MDSDHAIIIDQVVKNMNTQLEKSPIIVIKFSAVDFCSIFRVPEILAENNKKVYKPRIVSIGPYHHGREEFAMMQQHKWRFLRDFLARTGIPLEPVLEFMMSEENNIRQYYSESIEHIASTDLVEMMVLDGVFLIELFQKVGKLIPTEQDDPIFRTTWLSPILMRDLLKIENQIPFFVLRRLFYWSSHSSDDQTLPSLVLEYFNHAVNRRPEAVSQKYDGFLELHILDLFRKSFIITGPRTYGVNGIGMPPKLIQPASKLVIYGVTLKPNYHAESLLDIKFQNGVLLIPRININDFYNSFLSNAVAFEQCHSYCPKEVTAYIVFLGCLLNKPADVVLLLESGIIDNFFGADADLVKFFSDLAADVAFDNRDNYLASVFIDVNTYCSKSWHKYRTGFKQNYFKNPWVFFSALAAILLLLLAALQTFYTIYSVYHK